MNDCSYKHMSMFRIRVTKSSTSEVTRRSLSMIGPSARAQPAAPRRGHAVGPHHREGKTAGEESREIQRLLEERAFPRQPEQPMDERRRCRTTTRPAARARPTSTGSRSVVAAPGRQPRLGDVLEKTRPTLVHELPFGEARDGSCGRASATGMPTGIGRKPRSRRRMLCRSRWWQAEVART